MISRNIIFTLLYHTPAVVSQPAAMPFTPSVPTMADIILGDSETGEYLCLPDGEASAKEGISLEKSGHLVSHLPLNSCAHPTLGIRSL